MRSRRERPSVRRGPGIQRIWRVSARTMVGLGLVCALMLWPGILLLLVIGILGALTLTMPLVVPRRRAGRVLRLFGPVTLAGLGSAGLVVLLGWSGALLVALVWLSGLIAGRSRTESASSPADMIPADESEVRGPLDDVPTFDLPAADGIPDLDDSALCHAWRRSFVLIQTSRSSAHLLQVVQLRQLYLDELGRRHPVQLQSWLASGARAAGNPLPYLNGPAEPPTTLT